MQREDVVVSVPNWVKVAGGDLNLMFWQLQKCLPGQRNAATRRNEHLTSLLGELNLEHMQGTLFRHRERDIFLSAHIEDLLLIANEVDTKEMFEKLSRQLTLKIHGPYGVNEPGKLFYLKRQIEKNGRKCNFHCAEWQVHPEVGRTFGDQRGRGKLFTTRDHSHGGVFLMDKEAKIFRSALGIWLNIAQERLDIQQAVKLHGATK